jgi:hypothetical protein
LLRGIAAVADVPRAEDVGIDAIATLLRDGDDGNSYAEDSFIVQLKSESATSIEYRDHQLRWLLAQAQPMFIGVVSRKDARISLYPTLHVNQAALALDPTEVTVRFGEADPVFPWDGSKTRSATVWLGPPLLSWTLAQMGDPTWSASAYNVLKRFLGIARREYELLSLGRSSSLAWSTDDPDSIRSSFGIMKAHPDDLKAVADQCMPGLGALLYHAISLPEERASTLAKSLLGALAALRDLGVDVNEPVAALAERLLARPWWQMRTPAGIEDAT